MTTKHHDHHVVYRFYATNGDLLYVGKSSGFLDRLRSHQSKADWFEDVATITVEHFQMGTEAALAEEAAIRTERPLYNTQYTELGVILGRRHVRYPWSGSASPTFGLDGIIDHFGLDDEVAS